MCIKERVATHVIGGNILKVEHLSSRILHEFCKATTACMPTYMHTHAHIHAHTHNSSDLLGPLKLLTQASSDEWPPASYRHQLHADSVAGQSMERGQMVKITDSVLWVKEMDAHLRIPPLHSCFPHL